MSKKKLGLTSKIMIGMLLGALTGLAIKLFPFFSPETKLFLSDVVLKTGGTIFVTILKMLVIPIVFVSLVCGSSSLDIKRLGKVGGKTVLFYAGTTATAIALAITFGVLFDIGGSIHLSTESIFTPKATPSLKDIILDFFPSNFFEALAQGKMLQIILFSLLLGVALSSAGEPGKRVLRFFEDMNHVIIKLVIMVLKITPYGVFCLIGVLLTKLGWGLIQELLAYFLLILFVLAVQLLVTYGVLLRFLAKLNPFTFLRKMYPAMLFAFSVSSSNASIPVVLETVEDKLGVKNSIASFVIPLGATINMDGTAIMQGLATVFIAHAYHVDIGITGYLTVIGMATLASIGTAGIPSVGLITLAMVLKQVGLPVEGISLVIGVDRLLDMARTAVNICGDATISCVLGRQENAIDQEIYDDMTV